MISMRVNFQMSIASFREIFRNTYGANVRVYKGRRFASDQAKVAEVCNGTKARRSFVEVSVSGGDRVIDVEERFAEFCGLTIQIESPDGNLADNSLRMTDLLDQYISAASISPRLRGDKAELSASVSQESRQKEKGSDPTNSTAGWLAKMGCLLELIVVSTLCILTVLIAIIDFLINPSNSAP